MKNIGEELKEHRESLGLTQTALAKATGLSQQKISYYETGKHSPSIDDCIILADYYGITLDKLVGRNNPNLN